MICITNICISEFLRSSESRSSLIVTLNYSQSSNFVCKLILSFCLYSNPYCTIECLCETGYLSSFCPSVCTPTCQQTCHVLLIMKRAIHNQRIKQIKFKFHIQFHTPMDYIRNQNSCKVPPYFIHDAKRS